MALSEPKRLAESGWCPVGPRKGFRFCFTGMGKSLALCTRLDTDMKMALGAAQTALLLLNPHISGSESHSQLLNYQNQNTPSRMAPTNKCRFMASLSVFPQTFGDSTDLRTLDGFADIKG